MSTIAYRERKALKLLEKNLNLPKYEIYIFTVLNRKPLLSTIIDESDIICPMNLDLLNNNLGLPHQLMKPSNTP